MWRAYLNHVDDTVDVINVVIVDAIMMTYHADTSLRVVAHAPLTLPNFSTNTTATSPAHRQQSPALVDRLADGLCGGEVVGGVRLS